MFPKDQNEILSEAVRVGDIDTIKTLTEENPVYWLISKAIEYGQLEIFLYVSAQVKPPESRFMEYVIAKCDFESMAKYGHIHMLQAFLPKFKKYEPVNVVKAITYAATQGHFETVDYLINLTFSDNDMAFLTSKDLTEIINNVHIQKYPQIIDLLEETRICVEYISGNIITTRNP